MPRLTERIEFRVSPKQKAAYVAAQEAAGEREFSDWARDVLDRAAADHAAAPAAAREAHPLSRKQQAAGRRP